MGFNSIQRDQMHSRRHLHGLLQATELLLQPSGEVLTSSHQLQVLAYFAYWHGPFLLENQNKMWV